MSENTLRIFQKEEVNQATLETMLSDERLHWAYGERMEDVHLEWMADLFDDDGTPLDRFSAGRAFGKTLEVDWWQEGDGFRVRALLDDGDPPKSVEWIETDTLVLESEGRDEHQLVLWGTYDKDLDAWAEARIPRPLSYPASWEGEPPKQVVLQVRDYRRDGAVVLTRFLAVEPFWREEE